MQAISITTLQTIFDARNPSELEFLAELRDLFLKNAPLRAAEMVSAIENDDRETLLRLSHNLKSGSRHLGALRLAEICQKIELSGRDLGVTECLQLLRDLTDELQKVTAELKEFNVASLVGSAFNPPTHISQ